MTPFSDVLTDIFSYLKRLHGIDFRWKDSDRRLRRQMPVSIVQHRHHFCMQVKATDAKRQQACIRHCVIEAADWHRSKPPAIKSCCHAGATEWRFPIQIDEHIIGTVVMGPCRVGQQSSSLPCAPKDPEALIKLLQELLPRLWLERDRERNDLDRQDVHPALQRLGRFLPRLRHDHQARDMATHCGVSISHLQHLCRDQLDETLDQLRQRALLQRAVQALGESAGPIGPIASQLGFRDQRYFAVWFKRHQGCSPSQWRRQQSLDEEA